MIEWADGQWRNEIFTSREDVATAERVIRHLTGVKGMVNLLSIKAATRQFCAVGCARVPSATLPIKLPGLRLG